jgi:formylglycine-generating enzyme required for sulfatase activity
MKKFIFQKLIALVALFIAMGNGMAGEAKSAPLPREVTINGVEFIHIPEGWFWYAVEHHTWEILGSPGHPFMKDVKVWLDGFYIAKFEARARDFRRFMASDAVSHRDQYAEPETIGCTVRRQPEGEYYLVDDGKDLPATNLSWDLATEFAAWMGFRLPTEGEWVKAARGTDRRMWPWGDEYPDDTFAGYNSGADCNTMPVDSFANGRSPYGVYNMAGNAFEFVQDWYNHEWDDALKDGVRNPALANHGTTPSPIPKPQKILKGGRWSSPANGISIYRRTMHPPDGTFVCFGVRFTLDEATVRKHLADRTATVTVR